MAIEYNQRHLQYFYDPVAESYEEGFWEAVKRRELVFQRCPSCGEWQHPPRPCCHKCKNFELEWVKSSGKGKVFSWVVFTREVNPLFKIPYEVVIVEMEDEKGVRFVSNMVGTKPDEIYFDMPVELTWIDATEDQPLPVFRKATA
jgi:uncharacterized OB-fold protein